VKVYYIMAFRKLPPREMTRHNIKVRSLNHYYLGEQ